MAEFGWEDRVEYCGLVLADIGIKVVSLIASATAPDVGSVLD